MCVRRYKINSNDLPKLIAIIPNEPFALHAILYILYFCTIYGCNMSNNTVRET